uniref:Uncharacterized protein n=1 Tax=Octopus bimaculoides TaxID=37653 RepID=A0A0L8FXV3_OCTBM
MDSCYNTDIHMLFKTFFFPVLKKNTGPQFSGFTIELKKKVAFTDFLLVFRLL